MLYVGSYELTIDAKNRLSVPSAVRKGGTNPEGQQYYVLPGERRTTLALYDKPHFERLREQIPPWEQLSPEARKWRRFESAHTVLLETDSQGRILLPERLLRITGIVTEETRAVVMFGEHDHLELWSQREFEQMAAETLDHYDSVRETARPQLYTGLKAPNSGAENR
jgi:MraZ protein